MISKNETDTEHIGELFAKYLRPGDILALFGDLGSGKTVFVRGLARGLGWNGRVTSPTFSLVNEYLSDPPLFHFDMYRLSGSDDLFELGWEDYLERGGICAVEWSERISDALPSDCIHLTISPRPDGTREITAVGRSGEPLELKL